MLNFYRRGNSMKVFGKDLRLLGELSNLRLSSGERGVHLRDPASGSNFLHSPRSARGNCGSFPLSEILRNLPCFIGSVGQLHDFDSMLTESAESWRAQGAAECSDPSCSKSSSN